MKIFIPQEIYNILDRFNKNGYEAYVVGGCVRDNVLNITPKDWDICTSALPQETINLFNDYDIIETGLKHGTITLLGEDDSYEITTFRIDGDYSDGRHPNEVYFTKNLKEDLSRRDLTINALAADKYGNVKDYFAGINDIKNKIIRCVGDPVDRYNEDALRILRTLRFASIFNFSIDEKNKNAIKELYTNLSLISQERITSELVKLLRGQNCTKILREYSEVIFFIIPEIKDMKGFNQNNPYHKFDIWEHTLNVLNNLENKNDDVLNIATLFHDVGKLKTYSVDENNIGHFYNHPEKSKEIAEQILKRMKFPNKFINNVLLLIKSHNIQINPSKKSILKLLNKMDVDLLNKLFLLKKADSLGKGIEENSNKTINNLNKSKEILDNININKECFSLKSLNINGKDLIDIGLTPGKQFKDILEEMLSLVINNTIENDKEILLDYILKKYLNKKEE